MPPKPSSPDVLQPQTAQEFADVIRESVRICMRGGDETLEGFYLPGIAGCGGRDITSSDDEGSSWSCEPWMDVSLIDQKFRDCNVTVVASGQYSGIIENCPGDQVVRVRAGTDVAPLNDELKASGQCIPVLECEGIPWPWTGAYGCVGAALSMNLPHGLMAQCGSWRDWILGATVVLADGTIAKCGGGVVKNVAGYDIHRFLVSSRQTLAIVLDVSLRTVPVKSLPTPQVTRLLGRSATFSRQGKLGSTFWWIQRVRYSDWATALDLAAGDLVAADHAAHVLYALVPADRTLKRYAGDWVLRSGCGPKNLELTDPAQIALMRRVKDIFDPTHKLNPGEMGIF